MFKQDGEVMLRPQGMVQAIQLETPVGKVSVPAPVERPVVLPSPAEFENDTPFAPVGLQYANHAIYVL